MALIGRKLYRETKAERAIMRQGSEQEKRAD
jgi:hypothetical protein